MAVSAALIRQPCVMTEMRMETKEKVKEETTKEPIVVLSSGFKIREHHPLGKQLGKWAKQMGGRFVELNKLLKDKGVDRVK